MVIWSLLDDFTVYRFHDAKSVYFSDCLDSARYTTTEGKTTTHHYVSGGGK